MKPHARVTQGQLHRELTAVRKEIARATTHDGDDFRVVRRRGQAAFHLARKALKEASELRKAADSIDSWYARRFDEINDRINSTQARLWSDEDRHQFQLMKTGHYKAQQDMSWLQKRVEKIKQEQRHAKFRQLAIVSMSSVALVVSIIGVWP